MSPIKQQKMRPSPPASQNPGGFLGGHAQFAIALIAGAGVVYSLHLGRDLDASEAYTALAASQPSYAAVIRTALRFDPGKPPLYQILLHSLVVLFGEREAVLRTPSVIFSMINVGLLVALGSEMFEPAVGVAAAVLWALSPPALIFGGWARMYAMLVAFSLAQLLILWRLRWRTSAGWTVVCGVLGAMMLYTHLGAGLFLSAEAAMLAGAAWRGQRTRCGWLALLLSLIAFLPFIPTALGQLHDLINGHWVDWIGPAHHTPLIRQAAAILSASALCALLTFGPGLETEDREPVRWCAVISLIPMAALAAGSIAIRPMFAVRYVSPSLAVMALLVARGLAFLGARALRLIAAAIATVLVCLLPYYPWYQPWSDIARIVSSGSSREPVFFEPNFTDTEDPEANPAEGFPRGFLRVVFDRYFSGNNPRLVVDPSPTASARETIARAASAAGGAWLVSGFGSERAREELPDRCFSVQMKATCAYAHLYHIEPLAGCRGAAQH